LISKSDSVTTDNLAVKWKNNIIPKDFSLSQNYPNPFNPVTTIRYGLPKKEYVNLTIYNALGQKVLTLVNDTKPAGFHQIQWNASGVGSGIYFYIIQAGDFKEIKKCLIIK